eukprot:Sro261_g101750.2  (915) ;mRNA; r:39799-43392
MRQRWVLLLHVLSVACWWPSLVVRCSAAEFEMVLVEPEQEPVSYTSAAFSTPPPLPKFPSVINLRVAVFHAPPFATVEELPNGTVVYGGFQKDLLESLVDFAAADNVTLNWNLSVAPLQYGASFDLVANDCHQVAENPQESCGQLDVMVANFYSTPDRALRADMSPPWLRSSISTVKYVDKTTLDFSTLSQAEAARAWVCLKDGTFYAGVVKARYPKINYLMCPSQDDCLLELKAEKCVLYADDELQLYYRAAWDPQLEVTKETFNTQYIAWARSYRLDPIVLILLNRWALAAVTSSRLDELYSKYFQKALCPVGTAGDACELPCDPNHGSADANGVCVCSSTKWTGDDCSVEVAENTNLIPATLLAMAYAMLGVNVLSIIGCGVWLIYQRQSTQVRVSQPFFLNLVLLGCLISTCTIIPLAQQDEADGPVAACMAIPWMYSVGFSITFGTLFAKIRRVFIIFKSAIDMRRNIVTFKETFCVIGAVLALDVTILIVWTVVDPLEWERKVLSEDQFGAALESVGYCNSDQWMVFAGLIAALHLCLLGTACYMCYVSRSIPTKFSEGKYVSIAMISNLQIFVVGVPILVMLGTDPQTGFFVRCVIIWMNDLAVVALIFGNLIYSVHWGPKGEEGKDVKSVVSNAVQQYSRAAGMSSNRQMFGSRMDSSYRSNMDGSYKQGSSRWLSKSINSHNSSDRSLNGGNGSDHLAAPSFPAGSPEPLPMIKRKSSSDLRIPPIILESAASQEGSQAEVARVSRASIEADVLGEKTSWAGISMSTFETTGSLHTIRPKSESEDTGIVKRDDVLSDNKASWGRMNLSTVLYDENPSKDSSEASFHDDDHLESHSADNDNIRPSQSPLTPIAEDKGLEPLPEHSGGKLSNSELSDPALCHFTSENETEETSGFFNLDDVSDVGRP